MGPGVSRAHVARSRVASTHRFLIDGRRALGLADPEDFHRFAKDSFRQSHAHSGELAGAVTEGEQEIQRRRRSTRVSAPQSGAQSRRHSDSGSEA